MSDQIRVRVETGMIGKAVGETVDLTLTPLVQAAINDQRLTVVEQPDGEDPPELKGAALDEALRQRGLPLTGSADEKRARLADAPPPGQLEQDNVVEPPLGGAIASPAGVADARTGTAAPTDQT